MFDHVILTRFNLPSAGYEGVLRASPLWLENRMELFERYCIPSILSQTEKNFQWLIFFDPQTPEWAKTKIENHQKLGYYRAFYREAVPKDTLMADICSVFEHKNEWLLTTRLDNDDLVARDFVQRVQQFASQPGAGRKILNFPEGYTYSNGLFYRHRDLNNAFTTMLEPWDGALTIWHDWHTRLAHYGRIEQLSPAPAWVQVIHGQNISNRVRGRLVSPENIYADFEFPRGEATAQSPQTLAADHIRYLAIRQPREMVRRLGRIVIPQAFHGNAYALAKRLFTGSSGAKKSTGMAPNNPVAIARTRLRNWIVMDLHRWYLRAVWGMDIGVNTRVSLSAHLDRSYPKLIHIGRDTNIGRRAAVFCHDDVRRVWTDTYIGDRCLIGAHALISAGVRIGDGSIVSAGSVVIRDVPPGSLATGNPARIVETGIVTGPFGAIVSRGTGTRGSDDNDTAQLLAPPVGTTDADGRIRQLLQDVLQLEPGFVSSELAYNDTPGWDSVAHMTLVAGLEHEFGIVLSADEILAMNNFAHIQSIVRRHAAAASEPRA